MTAPAEARVYPAWPLTRICHCSSREARSSSDLCGHQAHTWCPHYAGHTSVHISAHKGRLKCILCSSSLRHLYRIPRVRASHALTPALDGSPEQQGHLLSLGMADGAVLPVYMPTSALLHVVSVWFQHCHPEVESQLESRFQLELPVGD